MLKSLLDRLTIGEWNIGFSKQNFPSLITRGASEICLDVRWMQHSYHDSFFADPFIIEIRDNKATVVAEEFSFINNKGNIVILDIDLSNATLINKQIIIQETHHLSYPFYSAEYKSIFPEGYRGGKWTKYNIQNGQTAGTIDIMNIGLIDATPFYYHDKWWIFAMTAKNPLSDLYIYYSDTLHGRYIPHALNPVKTDIASSRPAGSMFILNNSIYRPVQDSTVRYGQGIHLMRVTDLSEHHFTEEKHCEIRINNSMEYPLGFHTINFTNEYIIIDGYREKIRPFSKVKYCKIVPLIRSMKHASD